MHIPRIEVRSLDETVEAIDLGQTPADVIFLSFSDSDLNALARAYEAAPEPKPTLRLASLAALRHPYSIDLYLERVCALCAHKRQCGHELAAGKAAEDYAEFCPNADTLFPLAVSICGSIGPSRE